jgi:CDGSH-type Zn-finger protein/uncharacterized Fe-S cluster protein YjdI
MPAPERETLLHTLYEAAELEHNLMCTYLYAAFSLKDGTSEGLSPQEADAVQRWRREIVAVAIEEMGHLLAMWNLTAAIGGAPRFGRANFPLDAGYLPASIVVKLAPFDAGTLQHFIHLERPAESSEPEGPGFAPERQFTRSTQALRLTPSALDYETVGAFYTALAEGLQAFVQQHGEAAAFCGDPTLQLDAAQVDLPAAKAVRCHKTAVAAIDAIVRQGEGAAADTEGSHFQRFVAIRSELQALQQANPAFKPAHPAATNPVLRRPPRPEGRVWLEDDAAIATVDLANATYQLMLRLLALTYTLPASDPDKALFTDLGITTMRAMTPLGEQAARLPAGPSNPGCHAGMSFTALRDAAALPPGASARRFVVERLQSLAAAAQALSTRLPTPRTERAAKALHHAAERAARGLPLDAAAPAPAAAAEPTAPVVASTPAAAAPATAAAPASVTVDGVETVQGTALELSFETKRCIHARFCVTGAPQVFLANVQGAWIFPDAMPVARVVEVAHACPSGAIRYRRKDGQPDETPPPVNLATVREAGPYAVRGELVLDGQPAGTRATLCRCGASRNKPFCDSSHHDVGFSASGEPPTGVADKPTEMLAVRNGPLRIDPEPDGPLAVRGALEVTSGTGRMVARVQQARLCRCGGSSTKPFCDGTHARIGFRSS